VALAPKCSYWLYIRHTQHCLDMQDASISWGISLCHGRQCACLCLSRSTHSSVALSRWSSYVVGLKHLLTVTHYLIDDRQTDNIVCAGGVEVMAWSERPLHFKGNLQSASLSLPPNAQCCSWGWKHSSVDAVATFTLHKFDDKTARFVQTCTLKSTESAWCSVFFLSRRVVPSPPFDNI